MSCVMCTATWRRTARTPTTWHRWLLDTRAASRYDVITTETAMLLCSLFTCFSLATAQKRQSTSKWPPAPSTTLVCDVMRCDVNRCDVKRCDVVSPHTPHTAHDGPDDVREYFTAVVGTFDLFDTYLPSTEAQVTSRNGCECVLFTVACRCLAAMWRSSCLHTRRCSPLARHFEHLAHWP